MQHRHDASSGELVDAQFVELAVEVFSMLAEPTRVRIVLALQGGELPVNTIAAAVDKAPAAVSQHLAKLRLARIVADPPGRQPGVLPAGERARGQLVTDAIHQAEHALGQPRHHQRHRGGPRRDPGATNPISHDHDAHRITTMAHRHADHRSRP